MSDARLSALSLPAVPPGVRVYAVGDIHGRFDLLVEMHRLIAADAARAPDRVKRIVYLGDYIDRGNDSHLVIDQLAGGPPPGFDAVHLRGNHEDAMIRFMDQLKCGAQWMRFGGLATLAAYGVGRPSKGSAEARLQVIQAAIREALPAHHARFLNELKSHVVIGDYLFVHAGVRPGVPLDQQRGRDLFWIREGFLDHDDDFGKVVVHGHTITPSPVVRHNRIGIDTGAIATNRLTCLVLDGTDRWFLTTGDTPAFSGGGEGG